MADITMCHGNDCPLKNKCYRYTAYADQYWQSIFTEIHYKDGKCNQFMEVQKMHKSVIINVVGNKVIAYCDNKIGVARCHPDDDFDFYIGAKIALERLEEAEKPYGWLKDGMIYYVPDVTASDLYGTQTYSADKWDKRYMERGIAFQTREEAVACAKKMLAAVKQEG